MDPYYLTRLNRNVLKARAALDTIERSSSAIAGETTEKVFNNLEEIKIIGSARVLRLVAGRIERLRLQ